MRERPILFSAPMVRAILEGRKTVTRRVVKGMALEWLIEDGFSPRYVADPGNDLCPYGQPGDRLWVRETYFGNHYLHPHEPEGERELHFRADGVEDFEGERIRWRPGIHMPRWASRITLEVTAVRVERLQDISEVQAHAEGIDGESLIRAQGWAPLAFERLWESINGAGSWAVNPYVWVVEFRRVEVG